MGALETMKVTYRGHELEAKREQSLGGYELMYWSIFRDQYECASGFEDSDESEDEAIVWLKQRVDNELAEKYPWSPEHF